MNAEAAVVLIVDDIPENLAVLSDTLDAAGYFVLIAVSGREALERVRLVKPDIVLLDAVMPGLDGFEVCRRLKADASARHIPVVFMTGLTETEHVLKGFTAGGVDYVTKPIRPEEVLARVEVHVHTARLVRQAQSAIDLSGRAMAVMAPDGTFAWQTERARAWLEEYFQGEPGVPDEAPETIRGWAEIVGPDQEAPLTQPISIARSGRRLCVHRLGRTGSGETLLMFTEEDQDQPAESLMRSFNLTSREAEVLMWAAKGKTNRDIGEILGISPRTVNKHLDHVYTKLGVETRTAAAALAMRMTGAPRGERAPAASDPD